MSLRQYDACVAAWNRAHGAKEQTESPTEEEFDEMKAKLGDD